MFGTRLGRTSKCNSSESYTWSSDGNANGTADDGDYFGTPTILYGTGSFATPDILLDQTQNVSYSQTDYTNAIDPLTDKGTATPIVTIGWSWQADGSSSDPTLYNVGMMRSDFTTVFDPVAWQNQKVQRTLESYTRSYTSDVNRDGSYDAPIIDAPGNSVRSFLTYDWTCSYDENGRLVRDQVPTSQSTSQSFDGFHYSRTDSDTQNDSNQWNTLGRVVPYLTTSNTWSSDDSIVDSVSLGAATMPTFGDGNTLTGLTSSVNIYGGGTFADPIMQLDGSENVCCTRKRIIPSPTDRKPTAGAGSSTAPRSIRKKRTPATRNLDFFVKKDATRSGTTIKSNATTSR